MASNPESRQTITGNDGGAAPTEHLKTIYVNPSGADSNGFVGPYIKDEEQGASYTTAGPDPAGSTAVQPDPGGVAVLLAKGIVADMNDNSVKQVLYTAPLTLNTGQDLSAVVITRIIARGASVNLDTATAKFGWNTNADDVVNTAFDFSGLDASDKATIIPPDGGAGKAQVMGGPGDEFGLKVATEQGAPAQCVFDVEGYLIPLLIQ